MQLNLPRGTIFLAAAVVAGLVATFGIHRYVSMKTKVVAAPTRQVIIASADISPGTALSGTAVKVVSRLPAEIPPNCAATVRDIEGRVAQDPIPQGIPILFSMLAPVGTAAGLSGILDDGKRALTVKVDEVTGVAGFIRPRDHVDVLMDLALAGQKDHFSKTILHDIKVLSTGQIWEQKGDSKPIVVNTVTLEVTPDAAEKLNLASNNGKIRLALRNRNNKSIAQTAGVTTSILINGANAKPESKVAAQPVRERVEVIKGLDRTEAKL